MKIEGLLEEIRETLIKTFEEVDTWFDKPADLQNFVPPNKGWTITQILEHISLTSHFLLILIDKGVVKALKNVNQADLQEALQAYNFEREKLDEIGIYKSFEWIRPEHMEPNGEKSLPEVRQILKDQVQKCLEYLKNVPNGEGILYKTTMTVNNLGKIDVYEYIYFLAKHAERHLTQLKNNELAFTKS